MIPFPSSPEGCWRRSRFKSEKADFFLRRVFFLFIGVSVLRQFNFFLTAYATPSSKYEQEQTKVLAGYLSKLKFTEADGILLPEETLPKGFLFNYQRCSHRTMYVPRDGFTLIVSEESIWCRDDRGEQNRETVRTDLRKTRVKSIM